jgi:hypothetical protein
MLPEISAALPVPLRVLNATRALARARPEEISGRRGTLVSAGGSIANPTSRA